MGRPVAVRSAASDATAIERQLAVQSVGLTALGAVALLATLAAALQLLSRRFDAPLADLPTVVAMGFPPRRRLALGAYLAVPTTIVAVAVTAIVATLASPLVPTGFARAIDPTRGLHPDLAVTAAVTGLLVLTVLGGGVLVARRHVLRRARPPIAHDLRFAAGPRAGPTPSGSARRSPRPRARRHSGARRTPHDRGSRSRWSSRSSCSDRH